ncbi:hypothetical protein [Cycloclasticus sp.]|jgi:hypothetical protein|uniref:hypothetical protein n=1 Tax=Cycloclasticus sp. TaxID=2024830 RepID=UPI000C108A24|nr:hypothetical protein [Cycloclasticus sp.]PHR48479.1 MAG: hypothetical protein COA48_09260 [Cycloclasticus sp.]
MKGPVTLKQAEDNWQTNMGVFVNGERAVYRGKDIFNELADINWFKLIMFGITGREFSDKQIKLFEAIQVITVSYPEPRLWNNRIAALSGSARSTGILGLSAATACSEAKIFGNQANIIAIDFIKRAKKTIEVGKDLSEFVISELKNKRAIGGYGRPLIDSDERIAPLLNRAKELGLAHGPHLKLALEIGNILSKSRYRQILNASGLAAALMADQEFGHRDYYYATMLAFSAGIIPCYIDSANHKEGTFFPLSCQRLNYTGHKTRNW